MWACLSARAGKSQGKSHHVDSDKLIISCVDSTASSEKTMRGFHLYVVLSLLLTYMIASCQQGNGIISSTIASIGYKVSRMLT